jgi:hypothetical protein
VQMPALPRLQRDAIVETSGWASVVPVPEDPSVILRNDDCSHLESRAGRPPCDVHGEVHIDLIEGRSRHFHLSR